MKCSSYNPFHLKQLLLATAILGTASFSHAVDNTWLGTTDNTWSTSANNWTAPTAWVNGNDAIFGAAGVGAITVAGTVTAHSLTFNNNGYTIQGGGFSLVTAGAFINTNTGISASISSNISGSVGLTKTGAGTLTLSGASNYAGATTINDGVIEVTTLGPNTAASSIGTPTTNAAANLVFGSATATLRYVGSTITANSTNRGFTLSSGAGGGATIEASGTSALTLGGSGPIAYGTINQTRVLTLGGTNTGDNTLSKVLANNGTGLTSLTKSGIGKWVLSNTNTYSGTTTITGGTLALTGTGSIDNSSGVSLGTVGTFDVSGRTVGAGGTYTVNNLSGSGTVIGALTVSTTLAIGNSVGAVSFDSLALQDNTVSNFEIDAANDTADFADVTGLLAFEGDLNVTNLAGTLANGDTFNLFDFGSTSGAFDAVNLPSLDSGLTWNTSNLYTDGTIAVIPEPAAALLGSLGMLALLRRRRN